MFKMILPFFIVFSLLAASSYALVDAGSRGNSGVKISTEQAQEKKQKTEQQEWFSEKDAERLMEAMLGESWAESLKSEREKRPGGAVKTPSAGKVSVPSVGAESGASGEQPLAVMTPPKAPEFLKSGASGGGSQPSPQDLKEIERRMAKEREELLKRWQTVSSRAGLKPEEREQMRRVMQDLWARIESYYEQFKNSERSDYDKQLLRENIEYASKASMEDLRRSLSEDSFKRVMTENRYYDKPEQRTIDIQKKVNEIDRQLDEQGKQLRSMERKFQPSPSPRPSNNLQRNRTPFRGR
ncbi:MAG: hypothetical protein N2234_05190 [Planctomycetota bacterium]|nr:hypothetical protein [Planctomycetota bacterium]